MSRKDYKLLAQVIAEVFGDFAKYSEARDLKPHLVRAMCRALKGDNHNFDRDKFIEACGSEEMQ